MKKILRDESLDKLGAAIGGDLFALNVVQYLLSLRQLYEMVTDEHLPENYKTVIEEFKASFDNLFPFVAETPKVKTVV